MVTDVHHLTDLPQPEPVRPPENLGRPGIFLLSGRSEAESDDLDFGNKSVRSRLVVPLTPGDYFVRVGGFTIGRYVVWARRQ